jgi:hypothetical protein
MNLMYLAWNVVHDLPEERRCQRRNQTALVLLTVGPSTLRLDIEETINI